MWKWERYLFFYSIITVTVFAISYGMFAPKPINLLSSVLMLPMVFYFWIKLTSPETTSPPLWSLKFLFVLIIFVFFGINAYHLALKGQEFIPPKETARVEAATAPVPKVSPKASVTDLIFSKIRVIGNSNVKVYENFNISSKVVGSLSPNRDYLYSEKQINWYKVMANGAVLGWVNVNSVREVNE